STCDRRTGATSRRLNRAEVSQHEWLPDVTPAKWNLRISKWDIMMQETENEAFVRPLLKRGTALSVEARQVIVGFAIVLLVTIIGMLMSLQGWRSDVPAFDMATYFNSAETLLKTGTPARYGDISSLGSF